MAYTLTIVGGTNDSTPETQAADEADVKAKAEALIHNLGSVTNATLDTAGQGIIDLMPSQPEQPAEAETVEPSTETPGV